MPSYSYSSDLSIPSHNGTIKSTSFQQVPKMTTLCKNLIEPNRITTFSKVYKDAEEEIYSGNSQPTPPSVSSPDPREVSNPSNMSLKRSASDYGEEGAPKEVKRARASLVTSTTILNPSICSMLPEALWADILSLLHPAELGRQRRTCRLFNKSLDDESIWRRSRKRYLPDHPKPVFGLAEWEMLCVMWGSGCMLCDSGTTKKKSSNRPVSAKANVVIIYWPFRVRCCRVCLEENTTKEFTLLSSMEFPTALLPALPFGIVDLRNNWIPNSTHYQPNIGLTKIFWNADIRDILERYQEAVDKGAQEEWLKGLEGEGVAHKLDLLRVERFEKFRTNGGNGRKGWTDGISGTGNETIGLKSRQYQYGLLQGVHGGSIKQGNIELDKYQMELGLHQSTRPNTITCTDNRLQIIGTEPIPVTRLHGTEGFNKHKNYPGQLGFLQHSDTVLIQPRSLEAAKIQEKRRNDIEARCLQMVPCLNPELLVHMPAFQAAVKISLPLTEAAWERLKIKLLEQTPYAEKEESLKRADSHKTLQRHEEYRALDQNQKEIKEGKGEWDESQIPVRAKLGFYADEVIKSWAGSITKNTASEFAVDVLSYCRYRFYEETPYSIDDPHHTYPLDTTTRVGKETLEAPTTRRLTLENMKFVFDNKIRPYTDQFGRELFVCNGCEYNPRFYAFEGVIQHYAAKHTSQLSVGPIVVHWRTDWPAKLPFRLEPLAVRILSYQTAATFCPPESYTNSQSQPYPSHQETIAHQTPSLYASTPTTEHPSGTTYDFVSYQDYDYPPQHEQAYQRTIQSGPANNPPSIYLEQIAKDAREAWFQLSGIKDLPPSVRVHYVISRTITCFRAKFSYEPPLASFIETLKEYTSLKPVKNANGLLCLECHKNPPLPASDGTSRVGRLFTFSALLQHFETVHIVRNRTIVKPDWKTEMVKLPETRFIGMIRQAQGINKEKYKLLKDVFPLAFSLPIAGKGFNGVINHLACGHKLGDTTNRPNSPTDIIALEQQGMRPNSVYYDKSHSPSSTMKYHIQKAPQASINYHQAHPPISSPACYPKSRDSSTEVTASTAIKPHDISYSHRRRPLSKSPKSKSRAELHQLNGPAMTAAEIFLENFLRNTEDELQLDSKMDEDIQLLQSPRTPEAYRPSSPKGSSPKHENQKAEYSALETQSRHRPQITSDKSSKYNNEIKSLSLGSTQHDQYPAPPSIQSRDPVGQIDSRSCEIALNNSSHSRYPSISSHHSGRWPHSPGRSLSANQISRQSPTYPKGKYSEPFNAKERISYDSLYPPLPRYYRDIENFKGSYQDTHWSRIPPVVYPFPPLPSTLPGGCYTTQYQLDYRERARLRDPLLPHQPPPAQYSRYLPPRSPVAEIAYTRRSKSPAITVRSSSGHVTNPYEPKSTLLPGHYGIAAHDHRNSYRSSDESYLKSHRFQPQRDQLPRGPLVGVGPRKAERSSGKIDLYSQRRNRGRGSRGVSKADKVDISVCLED